MNGYGHFKQCYERASLDSVNNTVDKYKTSVPQEYLPNQGNDVPAVDETGNHTTLDSMLNKEIDRAENIQRNWQDDIVKFGVDTGYRNGE